MTGPTRINELSEVSTVAAADQVPIYSQNNGTRRASMTTLATFFSASVATGDNKTTQYLAPSASPFTVTVTPLVVTGSVWLILTPTGTLAVGTINLPPAGSVADRQEILINCTQTVTTLSVLATGLTVTDAPTTITAGSGRFRMRYDAVTTTWYRIA